MVWKIAFTRHNECTSYSWKWTDPIRINVLPLSRLYPHTDHDCHDLCAPAFGPTTGEAWYVWHCRGNGSLRLENKDVEIDFPHSNPQSLVPTVRVAGISQTAGPLELVVEHIWCGKPLWILPQFWRINATVVDLLGPAQEWKLVSLPFLRCLFIVPKQYRKKFVCPCCETA